MELIDTAIFAAGGAVLVLGIIGGWLTNRFWLNEPLISLFLGILIGPSVLGLVAPENLPGPLLLQALAHVTLGIVVMEAALQLPVRYLRQVLPAVLVALLVVLPLSSVTAAGLGMAFLGLPVLPAFVVGAIMAPTDPVLAASIVQGERAEQQLPERTRLFLIAESGANDGLGQMLLMLPLLLISAAPGIALGRWLLDVVFWDVIAAVAIGLVLGEMVGRLMAWARSQPGAQPTSTSTIGLALSVTVLAAVELIGSGSVLAVFAAGLTFRRYVDAEGTRHAHMQTSIGRFFTLPFFMVLGAELPWADWVRLGWPGLAFAVSAATLRRLPWWVVCRPLMAPVRSPREALFLGWFGPVGTAAIYYALLAQQMSDLPLWPLASLAVVVSALVHGITATPSLKLFGTKPQLRTNSAPRPVGSGTRRDPPHGTREPTGRFSPIKGKDIHMPARSKAQQKAAGAALSAKRGETKVSSLKGASKEMYETMSSKELDDLASTRRKGLPDRKNGD